MAKVIPLKGRKPRRPRPPAGPTATELEARIRELAQDSDNIVFDHPHIQQRMKERGVSMREVLETLRKGNAGDEPEQDDCGDWRLFMVRQVAGRRIKVRVAVSATYLTVVTVMQPT